MNTILKYIAVILALATVALAATQPPRPRTLDTPMIEEYKRCMATYDESCGDDVPCVNCDEYVIRKHRGIK